MGIKNILFDFDGVILDSMEIRSNGFETLFKDHPQNKVDELIKYHEENGGLSRYIKIKMFYEEILNQEISDKKVFELADEFSKIMKIRLTDKNLIINETLNFIQNNFQKYRMHIVSGSDQNELRFLCNKLEIEKYFLSILGSPIPKNQIVEDLLTENSYKKEETILIGDSINDFDAAINNGIEFYGYNNVILKAKGYNYLDNYNRVSFH